MKSHIWPDEPVNTHGITLDFGKHKGQLLTRVPVAYLRWMLNESTMNLKWRELAKAEFERRGDTIPTVEITGHAIDRASLRVLHIWEATRNRKEGLYSWLMRVTLKALEEGKAIQNGKIVFWGMKLVIEPGAEFSFKRMVTSIGRYALFSYLK